MLARAVVFHGDVASAQRLALVVEHNCACQRDGAGRPSGACGAHRAVLEQRFIDGLLFGRFLMQRLVDEEMCRT